MTFHRMSNLTSHCMSHTTSCVPHDIPHCVPHDIPPCVPHDILPYMPHPTMSHMTSHKTSYYIYVPHDPFMSNISLISLYPIIHSTLRLILPCPTYHHISHFRPQVPHDIPPCDQHEISPYSLPHSDIPPYVPK